MGRIDKAIAMARNFADPAIKEFQNIAADVIPWKDTQDATIIANLLETEEDKKNKKNKKDKVIQIMEDSTTFSAKKGGSVKRGRGMGAALRGGGMVTKG